MTGPLAIIQTTCKDMGWTWTAPFTFLVPVGHGQTLEMHLLQQEDAYFLHIFEAWGLKNALEQNFNEPQRVSWHSERY